MEPDLKPGRFAYDWSGFYAGVQAGYGWGESETDADDVTGFYETSNEPDGITGGVFGGYNLHTVNDFVFGVDADISYGGQSDSGSDFLRDGAPWPGPLGYADIRWTAAARARLGYALGRFLPYMAGGVAVAGVEFGYDWTPPPESNDGDATMVGWTAGAGAEYAISDRVALRLEYRYADYGSKEADLVPGPEGGDPTVGSEISLSTHSTLLGVSVRF